MQVAAEVSDKSPTFIYEHNSCYSWTTVTQWYLLNIFFWNRYTQKFACSVQFTFISVLLDWGFTSLASLLLLLPGSFWLWLLLWNSYRERAAFELLTWQLHSLRHVSSIHQLHETEPTTFNLQIRFRLFHLRLLLYSFQADRLMWRGNANLVIHTPNGPISCVVTTATPPLTVSGDKLSAKVAHLTAMLHSNLTFNDDDHNFSTHSGHWCWLITVLRPTQHKIGHFRVVLPNKSLGLELKKLNVT